MKLVILTNFWLAYYGSIQLLQDLIFLRTGILLGLVLKPVEWNTEVREQSVHFLLSPVSPGEIFMETFNLLAVQQVIKLAKSQWKFLN